LQFSEDIPAMTKALDILKSQSLTSVLQHEIEELVLSGSYRSGQRLNEKALAERFNVSRGPVREACRALAKMGLLELVPNRGVLVRRISRREAEDLYDVRATLFGLAARLTAARITPPQMALLDSQLERMEAAAETRSLDTYYPLNLKFHESILELSGNLRLVDEYFRLIKELHLFRARGLLHGGGLSVSNSEHRKIADTLRKGDPLAAFEAAFEHVQNGKQRMLSAPEETTAPAKAGPKGLGKPRQPRVGMRRPGDLQNMGRK
jgi:DNA-binding GntR family transcriptional regulator